MTPENLAAAHRTASRFLEDHRDQIAATLRTKTGFIEALIKRISSQQTGLEERLECFARIGEIARLIESDADGFFDLASRPVVARILSEAPLP
jgi:hypothetical protein